jgi:glutaredoxin
MKEINVYSLEYCSHCKHLKEGLEKEGITFTDYNADTYFDESKKLEELLDTDTYPIVEVKADSEVIYFVVGEYITQAKLDDGIYKETYQSIQNLVFQLKNL